MANGKTKVIYKASGKTKDFATSKTERVGYYSYSVGINIVYMFVTLFLTVYFTNALAIPASIVGAILLGTRIWDAINDPLIAILIEKSNLKGGKFKPWVNAAAVLIPASTVLMFSFTNALTGLSLTVRVIYATVTYILWGMIYTVSDVSDDALATVMVPDSAERNIVFSYSKMLGFIGLFIAVAICNPLVDATNSWFFAAAVISIITLVFLLPIRACRERVTRAKSAPALKQIIKAIGTNKYLMILVLVMVISKAFEFSMTITPFLASDVFNDQNITLILMALTMVPILVIAPVIPPLAKKFGKINLYKFTAISGISLSLVIYFAGYHNMNAFIILSIIKSILGGANMILPTLFFADCVEYYYYAKGERYEAATFSAQSFSTKAVSAIAGGGAMLLLAAFGYIESTLDQVIVQTNQVVNGIWLIYSLGPIPGAIVSLVIFWIFYDLSEAKLNKMKLDREAEDGSGGQPDGWYSRIQEGFSKD